MPDTPRTSRFNGPSGAPMWGVPGLTGKTDSSDGWYVAGTFSRGNRNWKPVRTGRTVTTLTGRVRNADQVSIAYVRNGQIMDYRTVHGPITSLRKLKQLIERETMVHSPVG